VPAPPLPLADPPDPVAVVPPPPLLPPDPEFPFVLEHAIADTINKADRRFVIE
jgi:hypothetical protein